MNQDFIKERERLEKQLQRDGRILSNDVEDAFLAVPREEFIPNKQKPYSYVDKPLDIGSNQTISAPHMVAIMVEAIDLKKGQKILEIGAGSGYHAAIVAHIVGKEGKVISVERIESLAESAKEHLNKAGIRNVEVIVGDGSMGLEQYAPYDHIYVTCAAPLIPKPLIDQLKNGGSLLIPVGDRICDLQKITKKGDETSVENLGGCAFVPLIGKNGF